mmetsp:Transcript_1614/g.3433  ORF Transcript_1614/g.3433 Transcript_1614/m.3433 type:complete len:227 (-) Transcript_1614:271-951(-)
MRPQNRGSRGGGTPASYPTEMTTTSRPPLSIRSTQPSRGMGSAEASEGLSPEMRTLMITSRPSLASRTRQRFSRGGARGTMREEILQRWSRNCIGCRGCCARCWNRRAGALWRVELHHPCWVHCGAVTMTVAAITTVEAISAKLAAATGTAIAAIPIIGSTCAVPLQWCMRALWGRRHPFACGKAVLSRRGAHLSNTPGTWTINPGRTLTLPKNFKNEQKTRQTQK